MPSLCFYCTLHIPITSTFVGSKLTNAQNNLYNLNELHNSFRVSTGISTSGWESLAQVFKIPQSCKILCPRRVKPPVEVIISADVLCWTSSENLSTNINTTFHRQKPAGLLQAQRKVYSLYIVGAKLGVLNLLPAVGKLWGGENKQGKSRRKSLPMLLVMYSMEKLDTRNEARRFDWQLHSMLTYREQAGCIYLTLGVYLGFNTHCKSARRKREKY